MLINELLNFINNNGIKGTHIFVELCAEPDKIPFYEKFGFDHNEAQRMKMMYEVSQHFADNEKLNEISRNLIAKNRKAYEKLAKDDQ